MTIKRDDPVFDYIEWYINNYGNHDLAEMCNAHYRLTDAVKEIYQEQIDIYLKDSLTYEDS